MTNDPNAWESFKSDHPYADTYIGMKEAERFGALMLFDALLGIPLLGPLIGSVAGVWLLAMLVQFINNLTNLPVAMGVAFVLAAYWATKSGYKGVLIAIATLIATVAFHGIPSLAVAALIGAVVGAFLHLHSRSNAQRTHAATFPQLPPPPPFRH